MEIINLIGDNITGEPLKDSIIIAIYFMCIWTFISIMTECIFTIFKKN